MKVYEVLYCRSIFSVSGFSAKAMPDNAIGHTYQSFRRVIFAVRDLSEGGLTIFSPVWGSNGTVSYCRLERKVAESAVEDVC
jgi:hypothetical protein